MIKRLVCFRNSEICILLSLHNSSVCGLKELEYYHHHCPYLIFKIKDWKIVCILAFPREDKHNNLLPEFFQQNLLHDKMSQTMPCFFPMGKEH